MTYRYPVRGNWERYDEAVQSVLAITVASVILGHAASAQGTTPKAAPEQYEVYRQAGSIGIGAEYTVHSFSRGEESYLAKDYLVVEVALFPDPDQLLEIRASDFTLRINGRKPGVLPQPSSMVASTLSHPEWRTEPHVELAGGIGDRKVIYGAPPRSRLPVPDPTSREPVPTQKGDPSGLDRQPPIRAEDLVVQVALPEGSPKGPVSGFLYFPYSGRMASVKTLELVYGSTILKVK